MSHHRTLGEKAIMKQILETIIYGIPKEIKNYHLIKRQDIYIPYCEIGITCLTKDTAEINLFFETILKFIDIGVDDINEIATVMGVEFKLIKEAVIDMIEESYIITSENKAIMTPKGKKALASRKVVTIRKRNINQIMVNMITGDMEGHENIAPSIIKKNDICLSEEQVMSKEFLNNHYSGINDIYQKNQVEYNFFNTTYLQRELYKILDFTYDKLFYVKEELLIYKNNDSSGYEFVISEDSGERYINCFYSQIRDIVYPGLENFFERDRKFADKNIHIVNSVERQKTGALIKKLYDCEEITDSIIDDFMQSRELIDNKEIIAYFLHQNTFECEGIIISCERFRKLFSNAIISHINEIRNKKIILLYDEKEYDIVNFLNKNFSELVKNNNIIIVGKESIESNYICFYPNVFIEFVEVSEKIFERSFMTIEGKIEFDAKTIKEKVEGTIDENSISFQIPKTQVGSSQKYKTRQTYKKAKNLKST